MPSTMSTIGRHGNQMVQDSSSNMTSSASFRQLFLFRELIQQFKHRQVSTLLETRQLDANSWLRLDTDQDEEEATGLIIIARTAASAAEKRQANGTSSASHSSPNKRSGDRRGSSSTNASGNTSLSDPMIQGQTNTNSFTKISKERVRMAKLLVKHGADVNLKDARGRTALTWASINGLNDLVYYLLNSTNGNYRIQDSDGNNALMYALPWPSIIQTYVEFMDEFGRPDSTFWRQRNRRGQSIFDLAKEDRGNNKSLSLLTQFITNNSPFTAFKAPAPIPPNNMMMGSDSYLMEGEMPMSMLPRSSSQGILHSSVRDKGPQYRGGHDILLVNTQPSRVTHSVTSDSSDQDLVPPHSSSSGPMNGSVPAIDPTLMKRSRSLREFWEKETMDWFMTDAVPDLKMGSNSSPPNGLGSIGGNNMGSADPVIKLPPIPSPLIRHEEWRERGHSLNRRTSVSLLRSLNPIH